MSSGGHGMGAMSGSSGTGAMRQLRGQKKEQPSLMDPSRERDGGRILRLFKPYRMRLGAVLLLIIFSSAISMLNPFLLRSALDNGIIRHNRTILTETVAGMI